MTIAAPNGTQPIWAFDHTQPKGTAKVAIAYSKKMPSKLVLPVVPGVERADRRCRRAPGLGASPAAPTRPFANRAAKP